MLKPMMGPLSEFGPGSSGVAVWPVPPRDGVECIGILVWIEAGSEFPGGWLVVVDVDVDVKVCVGLEDNDDDDDEEEACWRFTKRRCWSSDAA